MSQTEDDCSNFFTLSHDEIQGIADRLVMRATSSIATFTPRERDELILASRALRRLLSAYERAAGHQLQTIMICGGR